MAACSDSFDSSSRPYPARSPGFLRSLYSHIWPFFMHQPQLGCPRSHLTLRSLHVSHDTESGRCDPALVPAPPTGPPSSWWSRLARLRGGAPPPSAPESSADQLASSGSVSGDPGLGCAGDGGAR
jgi:hypothetical protein